MGELFLNNKKEDCHTAISNCFIDQYMPSANGEFVKLYIYLVRCASLTNADLSLEKLADTFTCTEGDITRALRYWENLGLLTLTTEDDTNKIKGISLEDCRPNPSFEETAHVDTTDLSDSVNATDSSVQKKEVSAFQENNSKPADSEYKAPEKRNYTEEDISARKDDEEVQEILCIAQSYLGKVLSVPEINTLLYFHESLGFSVELIDYLIEYCAGNNKKHMRYIESVALKWDEAGITTVEQAKANTIVYSKQYYPVMKAMGIYDRAPGQAEKEYIARWNTEFGFSTEIIIEACNRTISTIHQPSFQYANSILERWKSLGVKSMEDIEKADKDFKSKELTNKLTNKKDNAKVSAFPNAFSNFEQHSRDYTDLDKKLLATRH